MGWFEPYTNYGPQAPFGQPCSIVAIDQMTIGNVKGVTSSDEPTENHHLTLQFPSALQSFLESFSSLFWFSSTIPSNLISNCRQLFPMKTLKLTQDYILSR